MEGKTTITRKGQDKINLIIAASLNLIVDHGYRNWTLIELSRKTGLSKSQISYYFPNLEMIVETLFKELILKGQALTVESMVFASTYREKLIAVIDGALKWAILNPAHGKFFLLVFHLTSTNVVLSKMYELMVQGGRSRIEEILKEKHKDKTEVLAKDLHTLLIGYLVNMIALNETSDFKSYRKQIISGFENILKESIN